MTPAAPAVPPVVVMGVSGCGKSTVGALLAERLGVTFLEGDTVHPAANIAKMAAGHPLDDEDRRPWLAGVGEWLAGTAHPDDGGVGGGVVSCSALARRYRDQLREACPAAWFLHLDASRDLIAGRVAGRTGHFMPAGLVDSQLATLEPLGPDEAGLRVGAELPVGRLVEVALTALSAGAAGAGMWQARPMVLEIAVFTATPGHAEEFVAAYATAREVLTGSAGCLSARMTRGVENPELFTLLVEWETLDAHLEGFRGSDRFTRWRELLGPHFDSADVRHATDL